MNVFEKFRSEHPCGCQLIMDDKPHDPKTCGVFPSVLYIGAPASDDAPDHVLLMLTNGRGHDILAITADGQMHFAMGYMPSQQAEAFRQALNMASQRCTLPLLPPPARDCGMPVTHQTGRLGTSYVRHGRLKAHVIETLPPGTTVCRPTDAELAETARQFDAREVKPSDPGWSSVPPGKSALEK